MNFEKTHLIIAMAALLTASTAVAQQVELIKIATNDAPGGDRQKHLGQKERIGSVGIGGRLRATITMDDWCFAFLVICNLIASGVETDTLRLGDFA